MKMMLHNTSGPEDEEELISYLQRRGSATLSASSTWKIRTNELAQHEFRRERRAAAAAIAARKLSYEDLQSSEDGELGRSQQQFPVCLNALSYSSASSSSSSAASTSPLGQDFKQQKVLTPPPPTLVENTSEEADDQIQNVSKREIPLPCLQIAIAIATASLVIILFIFSLCCLGFTPYAVHQQPPPFRLVPT